MPLPLKVFDLAELGCDDDAVGLGASPGSAGLGVCEMPKRYKIVRPRGAGVLVAAELKTGLGSGGAKSTSEQKANLQPSLQ